MAAGLGTRMNSNRAKVLHELSGLPLIAHVCRAANSLEPEKIFVVVGHQASEVEQVVTKELGSRAAFVVQKTQRGTGDAVEAARNVLESDSATLLILSGDVPMIRPETLEKFVEHHLNSTAAGSLLSVYLENPTGYGRVIRNANEEFLRIVEQKDASEEERQIKEINAGIYCFDTIKLYAALRQVEPTNQQDEYYLTDVPQLLLQEGHTVTVYLHNDPREVSGINTRAELAEFENLMRRKAIRLLMIEGGVTFIDPSHTYISTEAMIGRDCVIYPNVSIEGKSVVGEGCVIRSGVRITNSRLGDAVNVKDHSVVIDSDIGSHCSVGPFAHLRMNARLEEDAAIGNFVEVKKSRIGRRSKAMHLSYLGDATIGEQTNIGAGTVTCNFDGQRKNETIIEDNVKIESALEEFHPRIGPFTVDQNCVRILKIVDLHFSREPENGPAPREW
ncbi:MAG: bifunctional UDP-N-acetylglucosamine diphosphorylase/glucosamine-1-phosphate N-acetyltransferase GlmU, partial [Pyrinomonadaceae bacterium]